MEEAQDQITSTQKRIKCGEIPKVEQDRISLLPDCLLVEILSRLPDTEEAIRIGTLSKRWQYLWTYVPTLIFRDLSQSLPCSNFFLFVDNAITKCRILKLNKFELMTCYGYLFESQLNNWIRYAVNCNVEKLTIMLSKRPSEADYHLQQFFYINSCFTHLRLSFCIVNPTAPIRWKNLKTLSISFVKLDEDLIRNILSGSPLLETWSVDCCYGYRRLDITSKSVKNLEVSGYAAPRGEDLTQLIVEINAPYILSLVIKDDLFLWKLLLSNVSSLVKANLDYLKSKYYETTDNEEEEEMLKGLILNLRHVKELEIGDFCSEVLSRLEAEGFVLPSNLKILENDSSELSDCSYCDSADSEDCEVDYGANDSSVSGWSDSDSDESGDWEMPLLDDGPNGDEAN